MGNGRERMTGQLIELILRGRRVGSHQGVEGFSNVDTIASKKIGVDNWEWRVGGNKVEGTIEKREKKTRE